MSEFSDIQPASQGGSLSGSISVKSGRDLAACFRKVPHDGEKVKLFFDLAEYNPEVAVPAFAEVLENQASSPMRALALQGLAISAQQNLQIKRALASCETDEDLQVLRDVAKEIKGKGEVSSDLTRWAAAWAIEEIGFSPDAIDHLEGGALTDPPYRIRNEIINRKLQEINKINRKDSRGEFIAEYERHLEFWLYGPTQELFRENSTSRNYEDLVGDVVHQLHGRGVYLGLNAQNRIVQAAALRQAKQIFKESLETEKAIYEFLEIFLSERTHEITFRIIAAEIISTASSLDKFTILSKLFLEDAELRNAAVRLLNPYKEQLAKLDPDAYTLLDALSFEYRLDNKEEPKDLSIPQIDEYISLSNNYHQNISKKFYSAINAGKLLSTRLGQSASLLEQFLEGKREEYLLNVKAWVQRLKYQKIITEQEQNKIQTNQGLLKKIFLDIANEDTQLYKKINSLPNQQELQSSEDCKTYNKCLKLYSELTFLKNELLSNLNSQKHELLQKYQQTGKKSLIALGLGFSIILVTLISPELSNWFQYYSPVPIGVQNFGYTSLNTSNTPPWYATGFPKSNCGSSSSANNCWYPVFIQYSERNWSRVLSNHCTDIGQAQSQKNVRKTKKIQIASFSSADDAQGFADYMKQQYESGWVGQKKCF